MKKLLILVISVVVCGCSNSSRDIPHDIIERVSVICVNNMGIFNYRSREASLGGMGSIGVHCVDGAKFNDVALRSVDGVWTISRHYPQLSFEDNDG